MGYCPPPPPPPPPLTKITPQKQQPPVLKLFKPPSPQTVYSTLRLEAKKHEGEANGQTSCQT